MEQDRDFSISLCQQDVTLRDKWNVKYSLAWENGQEHTMSKFARRMTFFSQYQSVHKNFHGNGLYIGEVFFFLGGGGGAEKSWIKKNKKQKQSKCGVVMPACRRKNPLTKKENAFYLVNEESKQTVFETSMLHFSTLVQLEHQPYQ